MEGLDLVVVGAGFYGLAVAKTYLELHQNARIVVLDAQNSVGGVWAEERLYPDLRTNNLLGRFEYPDFPMDEATYGVKAGEHIPGTVVHRYLTNYAKKFGVLSRTRFDTRVVSISRGEKDGWEIKAISGEKPVTFTATRLVLASGLTTEPNVPELVGASTFGAPIVHSVDFARQSDIVKTAEKVVVLGGAKSAWDIAYAFAISGTQVDMVVRKSGKGPTWMAPTYVTPLKKALEKLVTTRFLTWMSPCVWGAEDGFGSIRSWLHGTRVGRYVVDTFWHILESDVVALNGYDMHPEIKKMKPWHGAFYIGNGLSIFNYPTSPLDLIRQGKIRTHVADVTNLSPLTVHLSSGTQLKTDALFCATGWKHRPSIQWNGVDAADLGLPYSSFESEPLMAKANAEILSRFPRLREQPEVESDDPEEINHPYRLYRFMVPPAFAEERSVAFSGMMQSLTTSTNAYIQALWISAYLDNKIDRLPQSEEEIRWQTMLATQWAKLRYPTSHASQYPDFVFDAIPYIDQLLGDLGVKNHRKGGLIAELTEPYGPESYRGVLEEWKEKHV